MTGIWDSGFGIRKSDQIPNPESRIPSPFYAPPLYAILDVDVAARASWQVVDLADAYLRGGARFLQLRAKGMPSRALLDLARAIAARAREAGAVFIVNDRADIARLSGADGVHVGQDDLTPASVRAILGLEPVVGLSTHSHDQIEAAIAELVNYVAIGPVFGTATKQTGHEAIGLDAVRRASALTTEWALPLVAIGGITLDRAADVIGAGANAVAVISDLLATGDPEARVREYLERLQT